MRISIPYYKGVMEADLDAGRVLGAVKARHQEQRTEEQQRQIVAEALREPIESPRLRELAADKQRVLVITSDHTRPMPSAITLPLLLDEIRAGNPQAEIKIIVATGFHRSMTEAEMRQRFGDALFERETILVHDSRDDAGLTRYGTLPSGDTPAAASGCCPASRARPRCSITTPPGFWRTITAGWGCWRKTPSTGTWSTPPSGQAWPLS